MIHLTSISNLVTCQFTNARATSADLPSALSRWDNCLVAEGDVTMDFDVRASRIVSKEFEKLTTELQSKGSAGNLLCAKIARSHGAMDEEISV